MYSFSKMFSVIFIRNALLPTLDAPRMIKFIVVWFLIDRGSTQLVPWLMMVLLLMGGLLLLIEDSAMLFELLCIEEWLLSALSGGGAMLFII